MAKINMLPSHEKQITVKTLHSFWIKNITVIFFFFTIQIFIIVTNFWSWSKYKSRWKIMCIPSRIVQAGDDTRNYPAWISLFHLLCVIACTHYSTRTTSLTPVKNSTCLFCLWHLLSWTLERKEWKKDQKHQIAWLIIYF